MKTLRTGLPTMLGGALLFLAQPAHAQTGLGLSAAQGAAAYRDRLGARLTFVCPQSNGTAATVYGTDVYTSDSAVCAAAIHAGVLKPVQAGIVTIVMGSSAASFKGSQRNGVTTRSYGAWESSYTFARDGAPGTITWRTVWNGIPADFTDPITVECPARGVADGAIWGTDVYTRDSVICVAAVHAGAITAEKGGLIVVERARHAGEFTATERNGVKSQRWASFQDAFSVTAARAALVTGAAPSSLDPCPLPAAVTRVFAAIKTSIANEYAALLPAAQSTEGFDAAALTAQRDELLREVERLEQQNVRDGTAACAARITRNDPTPMTRPNSGLERGPAASLPQAPAAPPQTAANPSDTPRGEVMGQSGAAPPAGTVFVATGGAEGQVLSVTAVSPTAPPPPGFAIDDATPGLARIRWRGEQDNRDGCNPSVDCPPVYRLFRQEGPNAPWVQLAATPTKDTWTYVFTIDDVVPDPRPTYIYRLQREFGDGTWGEASASFTSRSLVQPTGFRARQSSVDTVTLEWDAAPGAVEYRIDGTGLPNIGRNIAGATTTAISPIRGEGTWQIAAIYAGNHADYANRPVATNVSRPLPTHAPAWLSKSNGPGSAQQAATHYSKLCNSQYRPAYQTTLEEFCGDLAGVLISWGADREDARHGPGGSEWGPGTGTPRPVGYTNVTELASHRLTACYFGEPVPGGGGLVCHSETPTGLSLIIMKPEGARFASYDKLPQTANDDPNYTWFWGHDAFGLAPTATFDSEGPKFVPHACLACHGGRYDPATGLVTGASLLPIDPSLVIVDGDRTAAEERIRAINSMIARASPSSPAVSAYINGMYGGMQGSQYRVDIPGTRAISDYVPDGWATQRSLYLDFVKKDCQMCHLAGPAQINFLTAGNLLANKAAVHAAVCTARSMPHAETPFKRFWTSGSGAVSGPGWFAAVLGFQSC